MSIHRISELIIELKAVELVEDNHGKLETLLLELVQMFALSYHLPPGENILRGRLIDENQNLHKRKDFSYCPLELNTNYKRASTPRHTMFYGSLFPDDHNNGNPYQNPFAKIIVLHELVSGISDATSEIKQHINLGVWRNRKPLHLFPICQATDFESPRLMIQKMHATFERNTASLPKELLDAIAETMAYLGNEFSKETVTPTENMVSAIFTNLIVAQDYDGILYSSKRMEGGGINLCITPKAVHNKLEFIGCGEACLYKKGTESFLNNLTVGTHDKGNSIQYRMISKAEGRISDEECWKEVSPKPKYTLLR